jgi:DNA modification methylase
MKCDIVHKDCLIGLSELDNDTVHLTFTSPPYYNARSYSTWETYEDYLLFLENVFKEVYRVTKEGRMCIVNISPVIVARASRSEESLRLPIPFHFFSIMERVGWKYIDDIVWIKPEGAAINRNGGFFQHRKPVAYKPNIVSESIFVFQKPSKFLIDKVVRSYDNEILQQSLVVNEYERSNVWKINPETNSKHPAPFPEKLSDNIIQYYSYVGDLVLDPFLGSGTTLVSCKKMNRNGIGFEIHDEYIRMTESRLREIDSVKQKEMSLSNWFES